jgi:PAS domain S-box-containing protein
LLDIEKARKKDLFKLDLYLNHTSDFLYRYNTNGEIIYASPNVERILGYELKESPVFYSDIHTTNPINNPAKQRIVDLLKGENDFIDPYFVEVFDAQGIPHMLEVFEKPDKDEFGQITTISGIARNITGIYRAELEVKQFAKEQDLILNALPDFLLTLNPHGEILSHYSNNIKLDGLSLDIENGKNISKVLALEISDALKLGLADAFKSGGLITEEIKIILDGKVHYCEARILKLTENKVLLMIRDVTAQKNLEEGLRASKDAAEQANLLKSNFIATMSHEIRTPMNGIVGMTNLLQETLLDREQRDYIETIKVSSDILLRIINDILDYSNIESGKIQLEESVFELKKVIDESLNLVAFEAKGKNIGLNLMIDDNVPNFICSDRIRLRQILMNLLSNAVKFTEKGFIAVRVKVISLNSKTVELEFQVKDTGIGVPSQHLNALFKHFSQGDSSHSRRFGGSGLGLAIVKNLVKLLKGKIHVESQENEGSKFTFSIKAKLATAELIDITTKETDKKISNSRLPLAHVISDKYPLKILLAEDNGINSKLICLVLEKMGFKPDIAKNGSIALSMFKETPYDVILMDIQMPVMDGIQATQAIVQLKLEHPPHIIGLSANAFEEDIAHALSIGMDDYFVKPIKFEVLKDKLKEIGRQKFPFVS